jgi:hypothetical protein
VRQLSRCQGQNQTGSWDCQWTASQRIQVFVSSTHLLHGADHPSRNSAASPSDAFALSGRHRVTAKFLRCTADDYSQGGGRQLARTARRSTQAVARLPDAHKHHCVQDQGARTAVLSEIARTRAGIIWAPQRHFLLDANVKQRAAFVAGFITVSPINFSRDFS